jgi:hypothetical protein
MRSDGSYERVKPPAKGKPLNIQEWLLQYHHRLYKD